MTLRFVAFAAMLSLCCSGTTEVVDTTGGESPIADRPNEPAGSTLVSSRAFNSVASSSSDAAGAEGWLAGAEGGLSNVQASQETATQAAVKPPVSPPGIIRFRYPAGSGGASSFGPGGIEKGFGGMAGTPAGGWRTIYVALWFRFSDQWQGHATGDQKMLEAFFGSSGHVRVKVFGSGQGPLTTAMSLLNTTNPSHQRSHANGIAGVAVSRGAWHRIEMVATLNTPGSANGTLKWWVDGTLAGDVTDLTMLSAGEGASWSTARFVPVWGGGGDTVQNLMLLDVDHIYVSVK